MPRFKCPKCGRKKIIMAGKSKRCPRCVDEMFELDPEFNDKAAVKASKPKQKPRVQR